MLPVALPGKVATTQLGETSTFAGVNWSGCVLLPSERSLHRELPRRKTKRAPAESGPEVCGALAGGVNPGWVADVSWRDKREMPAKVPRPMAMMSAAAMVAMMVRLLRARLGAGGVSILTVG